LLIFYWVSFSIFDTLDFVMFFCSKYLKIEHAGGAIPLQSPYSFFEGGWFLSGKEEDKAIINGAPSMEHSKRP